MTSFDVQPGDIYSLGPNHRLMCGDATNKDDVKRLFDGRKPTLVVTSPPYAKQRDYDRPITCWDSMMLGALDGHDFADDVQLLVNLGVIHKNGEWTPYWARWVQMMRKSHWRHFSVYIWDKLSGVPGAFPGRLTPAHEQVFHFNKKTGIVNKIMPCYSGRKSSSVANPRKANGSPKRGTPSVLQQTKPSDSVIRMSPVRFGESVGHPAQMPVALARHLVSSFKNSKSICYDCFAGSGTTLHAAQQEGVSGLGMEISPTYTSIALARWAKAYPDQQISKIN